MNLQELLDASAQILRWIALVGIAGAWIAIVVLAGNAGAGRTWHQLDSRQRTCMLVAIASGTLAVITFVVASAVASASNHL